MRQLYCSLGALCCLLPFVLCRRCYGISPMRYALQKEKTRMEQISELALQHGETLIEISCQSCTWTFVYNGAVKEQGSWNNDRVVGRVLNIN